MNRWHQQQVNVPTKQDHYLMRIATNILLAQGVKIKEEEMQVRFVVPTAIVVQPDAYYPPGTPRPLTQKDLDKIQSAGRAYAMGVDTSGSQDGSQGGSQDVKSLKHTSIVDKQRWERGEIR